MSLAGLHSAIYLDIKKFLRLDIMVLELCFYTLPVFDLEMVELMKSARPLKPSSRK